MFKIIYLKVVYRSKSIVKSGSILKPRYIRFRVISDHVISGLQCIQNEQRRRNSRKAGAAVKKLRTMQTCRTGVYNLLLLPAALPLFMWSTAVS